MYARQPPLAEADQKAKQATRAPTVSAIARRSPGFPAPLEKPCDCPGKQKHDETDPPDGGAPCIDAIWIIQEESPIAGVPEIAKSGPVRRADLREIFVGYPGSRKRNRTEEDSARRKLRAKEHTSPRRQEREPKSR